jgi:hypothetical protein
MCVFLFMISNWMLNMCSKYRKSKNHETFFFWLLYKSRIIRIHSYCVHPLKMNELPLFISKCQNKNFEKLVQSWFVYVQGYRECFLHRSWL